MSGICEKCMKSISKRAQGVKCGLCVSKFHIKCVDISEEVLQDMKRGAASWLCYDCRAKADCSIIDGTAENDNVCDPPNAKINDLIMILKGMQTQLDSLKDSSNYVCKTLDDIQSAMSRIINDVQQLNKRVTSIEKYIDEQDAKINHMEALIDRPAQISNENNIVVCGIPSNCDNLTGIIINIASVVGITITNDDILAIKQMSHYKDSVSQLKNSFIVTFNTKDTKNNILTAFRRNKTLYTNQLEPAYSADTSKHRILLLQHFTKFQSKLYNAAKTIKNKYNFQYLWCKENNINLRKSADSKIYRITSFNDISNINSSLRLSPTSADISAGNVSSNSGQTTTAGLLASNAS